VPQQSPFELKRGSVIPATLITGINSDLPGRITAQVSQSVYDSATGHRLLIPQGTKLFGRYDSKVSFGQKRVLVVWTDIIFPNGSTLQIGGMSGTDAQGYGGFSDKVNNYYLKTFGSAVLIALIGTGIDMAVPQSSTLATQDTASDATRRNFAETFGRVADRTIQRNMDVQPTLEIRPGYKFNVLVDQDIVFPGAFKG
jgi:type IV secretion system protein VirB10